LIPVSQPGLDLLRELGLLSHAFGPCHVAAGVEEGPTPNPCRNIANA